MLDITIAVSAIWLFQRRTDVPATPARTAARFVALAPLLVGLANLAGVASGLRLGADAHGLGLAAIKVIDIAVEQQRASAPQSTVLAGSA